MPLEVIDTFEVKSLQVVDEEGRVDRSLMPEMPDALLKRIFESLVFSRVFDKMAINLQREGRIGTYAPIWGQEAAQVGSAVALERDDWIFPSFRETGVYLTLDYPAWMIFRYWMGDERGMAAPEGLNIFPMSVPVGSHIPHAAGAAMAMKLKGARAAAVAYFGDGASSRGDFHESLNFAGVFKAPAVFICQNNQWAISVPSRRQTAARTIAQRAFSYGIEGVHVDGNDVVAVYKATREALERARSGGGATLIELFTYRLGNHTTADDARRYRSDEEVEEWKKKEPMIRFRKFLESRGLWSEGYEEEAREKAAACIDAAVKEAEGYPEADPADMIRYTWDKLSQRQTRELKDLGWEE